LRATTLPFASAAHFSSRFPQTGTILLSGWVRNQKQNKNGRRRPDSKSEINLDKNKKSSVTENDLNESVENESLNMFYATSNTPEVF
jgi:hypothetical protein